MGHDSFVDQALATLLSPQLQLLLGLALGMAFIAGVVLVLLWYDRSHPEATVPASILRDKCAEWHEARVRFLQRVMGIEDRLDSLEAAHNREAQKNHLAREDIVRLREEVEDLRESA